MSAEHAWCTARTSTHDKIWLIRLKINPIRQSTFSFIFVQRITNYKIASNLHDRAPANVCISGHVTKMKVTLFDMP